MPVADPISAVQAALYTAASAAVTPVKVFDTWGASARQALPYVCLETFLVRDARTRTENDLDVWARLHVWSNRNSRGEAGALAAKLRSALDGAALSVTGFVLNWLLFEETTASDDPGGASQLVLTFRLNLTPA